MQILFPGKVLLFFRTRPIFLSPQIFIFMPNIYIYPRTKVTEPRALPPAQHVALAQQKMHLRSQWCRTQHKTFPFDPDTLGLFNTKIIKTG